MLSHFSDWNRSRFPDAIYWRRNSHIHHHSRWKQLAKGHIIGNIDCRTTRRCAQIDTFHSKLPTKSSASGSGGLCRYVQSANAHCSGFRGRCRLYNIANVAEVSDISGLTNIVLNTSALRRSEVLRLAAIDLEFQPIHLEDIGWLCESGNVDIWKYVLAKHICFSCIAPERTI